MNPTKPDMFTPIHKGLRAMLFATSAEAARADLGDEAQVRALAAAVRRLTGLLTEHAGHEDAHVFPLLAAHAPALARTLGEGHVELERLQDDLDALASRLEVAAPEERPALGEALTGGLNRLTAAHLVHMDLEEREAAAVLLARCSPAELAAIPARINASMPPARGLEVLRLILPAVNPGERSRIIAALEAALPPAAMASVRAIAA
jgi:hypothetical protein